MGSSTCGHNELDMTEHIGMQESRTYFMITGQKTGVYFFTYVFLECIYSLILTSVLQFIS